MPKVPKDKEGLYVMIDRKLCEELKRFVVLKYGKLHGALSYEVEEALRSWLALHAQEAHKPAAKANSQPKVLKVFSQVKEYLKERYGYAAIVQGVVIPRVHLIEAIKAVRGCDPRTVSTWMKNFVESKLIKPTSSEAYEVL